MNPMNYDTGRKQHVRVPQASYLEALREVGSGRCDDIAEHFDVSPFTAKRHLDGLVSQGLLEVVGHPSGFATEYRTVEV